MKKYFHEIPQSEVEMLVDEQNIVKYILDNYKQPDWCGYPDALSFTFGCWTLCDMQPDGGRTKISSDYCKAMCDCFEQVKF